MLRYNRLIHNMYADTLIARTVSQRGNKNAQVCALSYEWTRAYAMKKKSDYHETLSILSSRDEVPLAMVIDG